MKAFTQYWHIATGGLTVLVLLLVPLARKLEHAGAWFMRTFSIPPLAVYALLALAGAAMLRKYYGALRLGRTQSFSLLYCFLLIAIVAGVISQLVAAIEFTHLVLYGGVSCSARMALRSSPLPRVAKVSIALCFALFLGVIDEFLQWLHPERVFDWRDIAINAVSAVIGVLAVEPLLKSTEHMRSESCEISEPIEVSE